MKWYGFKGFPSHSSHCSGGLFPQYSRGSPYFSDILFPYRSPSRRPDPHPTPPKRTRNRPGTDPKRSQTEPNGAERNQTEPKRTQIKPFQVGRPGGGLSGWGGRGGCKGKRISLPYLECFNGGPHRIVSRGCSRGKGQEAMSSHVRQACLALELPTKSLPQIPWRADQRSIAFQKLPSIGVWNGGRHLVGVWIGGVRNCHFPESEKYFSEAEISRKIPKIPQKERFPSNFRLRNLKIQSPKKCNSIPPAIPYPH